MSFINRIGQFFILVGFICVAIYFISEPESGGMGLLTGGVVSLVLGIFIRVKNKPEPEESKRFVSLRKINQKSREERKKRLEKRKAQDKKKRGY